MALPNNGLFGAIAGKKSLQLKLYRLKLHRLATANDRLRVAAPRALCDARARGDIDVNAVPDLNKATALAATGQTKAAAAPRIKLLPHGFSIDHRKTVHVAS